MLRRTLSLIIIVILFTSITFITPISAIDADRQANESSDGFILIRTIEDLYSINNSRTSNYRLMNDIDLSDATAKGGDWDFDGRGWEPIGSYGSYGKSPFTGIFDGNGYEISGLRIEVNQYPTGSNISRSHLGLFVYNLGTIKNLKVSGTITAKAAYRTGGITALNEGTIENCCSMVDISVTNEDTTNFHYVGGIAGTNTRGTISKCYNTGNLSNTYFHEQVTSSGLVYKTHNITAGITNGSGTIVDCFNTGNIETNSYNTYSSGIIVNHSDSSVIEGLVNNDTSFTVKNCYNTGLTKTAISYRSVKNCYYLSGSGNACEGAESLTSAQMELASYFTGFDFNNTWFIDTYGDYHYPQIRGNELYDIEIHSIELEKYNDTIDINTSKQLVANIIPEYTTQDKRITWSSSDDSVISVTNSGLMTANKKGQAVITATSTNGRSASCNVKVLVPMEQISLNKKDITMPKSTKQTITVSCYPSETTDTYTFSSSDTSVVTVDNYGIVTAKKVGTATITVTTNRGVSADCRITVNSPATYIKISDEEIDLFTGEELSLSTTVAPYDVTDNVTWSSSNDDVAVVDSYGIVSAKGKGTATVTARADSGVFDTCTVSVEDNINNTSVYLEYQQTEYDAEQKEPNVTVYYMNRLLTKDICYRVEYKNNTDHGIASVIINSLSGNSSVEKTFTITQASIKDTTIRYDSAVPYTKGKSHKSLPEIFYNSIPLIDNIDYELVYSDNTDLGIATGEIKGKGNFTGSIVFQYEIKSIVGDVDGDGLITIMDASLIQRYLTNLSTDYFIEEAAKTDRNEVISVIDATYILRYIASVPIPENVLIGQMA